MTREEYIKKPNRCLNCNNEILPKDNQRISDVKRKKFCNSSCSASYNNKNREIKYSIKEGICKICGDTIKFSYNKDKQYYNKREFCDKCRYIPVANTKSNTKYDKEDISLKDLKSNPYYKSAIRNQARRLYFDNNEYKCKVCGYDKHVEVAHIKAIADFADNNMLSEINDLSNLIGLCPNHHWEFDNGHLAL